MTERLNYEQTIKMFSDFAYSLIGKLKPGVEVKIEPGMTSFREPYTLHVLNKKKEFQREMSDFVDDLMAKVDPAVDRIKLADKLFEIEVKAWQNFTDKCWQPG